MNILIVSSSDAKFKKVCMIFLSTVFWVEIWEKPSGVVDVESGLHKDSLDGSFDVRYVFPLESLFLGMVRVTVSHQTLHPKKLGTK